MILSAILAFFTAIPGIGTAITSVTSAVYDAKVRLFMARTGVTRDVAVTAITAASADFRTHKDIVEVFTHSKILMLIVLGFALPIIAYDAKCIVWDTMLGWGSTGPLRGQVADHMNLLINWLFGTSTTLAAGSMALKAIDKLKG